MFSKTKVAASPASGGEAGTTLISPGTLLTGDVKFSGDMHVEGEIKGNISGEGGLLTIAGNGEVEGDIKAARIIIDGTVRGNVFALEHLELAPGAVILGNIYYKVIEMAKGAQLNGSMEHLSDDSPMMRPMLGQARNSHASGQYIEG